MWQDPIVEELRKLRDAHAASHHYDSACIYQELMEKEAQAQQQGVKFVSFPPKPAIPIK